MAIKVLEDVKMNPNFSSTYLSSAAGVLEAGGLWNHEPFLLAGMTGMAFQFIIHEHTCPSSVTVYDWQQEHFTMLDRIGVASEGFHYIYNGELNTFKRVQEEAISRIKESIDRGMGAILWAPSPTPEFGIIKGYDEGDRVLFIEDYTCRQDVDPLLFDNLGKSEVSILYYQIIHNKVDIPVGRTYRQSLVYGVNQWEKENHTHPQYHSGRRGYKALIDSLKKDEQGFGLAYIMFTYSKSKEHLFKYLNYIGERDKGLKEVKRAGKIYEKVSRLYKEINEMIPFKGPGTGIEPEVIPGVLHLVEDAFKLEEEGMDIIKSISL